MTTIYIVTSGDYSAYSINAVFDSQEKAQSFVDYHNQYIDTYSQADIDEWELNAYYDEISRGLKCFYVFFKDINVGDATVRCGSVSDDVGGWSGKDYKGTRWFHTYLWAKDEAAALKIANERRVQYLVNEEVPEEPDEEN